MNILNETGFDHFHSNSDLFGGSEAEELMKAVFFFFFSKKK